MDKHVVGISCRFDQEALAYLKSHPELEVRRFKGQEFDEWKLDDVECLIIRTKVKVNHEFLARTPKLRMVVTGTSGFDHIDFSATAEKNISVFFAPDGNKFSAAEQTFALVLAGARRFNLATKAIKTREWKRSTLLGYELAGKTYGVIGLGRIGTLVTKMAKGFDMDVVSYDPYVDDEVFVSLGCARVGFEELMKTADVISLHVPYTKETQYMINRKTLKWVEQKPILVNTSRGPVIREQDLVEAVDQGKFHSVGLDVFEKEPLPQHSALHGRDDIVLMPHVGANTNEAFMRSSLIAAEKVVRFLKNEPVEDVLPPRGAWAEHIISEE